LISHPKYISLFLSRNRRLDNFQRILRVVRSTIPADGPAGRTAAA
jgi:hypothetical protein